jgi:hypothetical protein
MAQATIRSNFGTRPLELKRSTLATIRHRGVDMDIGARDVVMNPGKASEARLGL